MQNIYTVNQINKYIGDIIDESNLKDLNIEGEISNLKKHSATGNYYLTLKDQKSNLKCIIFKNNFSNISFDLKEGLSIIATGLIKSYSAGGTYSFWINTAILSINSEGYLHQKYEKLKKFYYDKGYFDKKLKKKIPKFPENIGVITAPNGAAINDIISTINRRYNLVNIFLFPCIVQGINSAADIVKKLKNANTFEVPLDLIILGRGGGSFEDLVSFSDPSVIEEIYKSKIPIISAVGHEIDFQLSDFVSDLRAETPTAAAELSTPDKKELELFLKESYLSMKNNIIKKIQKNNEILTIYKSNYHLSNSNWIYKEKELFLKESYLSMKNNIIKKIKKINEILTIYKSNYHLSNSNWIYKEKELFLKENYLSMKNNIIKKIQKNNEILTIYKSNYHLSNSNWIYKESEEKLIQLKIKLKENFNYIYRNKMQYLKELSKNLKLLDPKAILSRGYSIVTYNNVVIKTVKNLQLNQMVNINLYDGFIKSNILEIKEVKNERK